MVSQMLQNSTTCTFIFNSIYLCSTRYIYIQQYAFSFNFNPNYFHSTKIFVQLQPKIISFNKNICSTSTKDNYIQQQYICSTSTQIIFIQQKIIIQLQPNIISFNNKVPGHSKYCHSTKFPVPPMELPRAPFPSGNQTFD